MGGIGSAVEALAPILGMLVVFSIPLIAILTSHQRKMAELLHRGQENDRYIAEIHALRREVDELKSLVRRQTQMIETSSTRASVQDSEIQQRLGP